MPTKTTLMREGILLECWRSEAGCLAGTDAFDDIIVGLGTIIFRFVGKTKTYIVVTNDERIERQDALRFATMHHKGQLRMITIDLRTL